MRWEKKLLKREADFYLRGQKVPESLAGIATLSPCGEGQSLCSICGYAQARLEIAGGWLLETCSAVGLRPLLRSSQFKKWLLAQPGVEPVQNPAQLTSAGLPGAGL